MGKTKIPATGEGYLGEIMVHRLTRNIGTVETVIEGKAGWPPQITLKFKDGSGTDTNLLLVAPAVRGTHTGRPPACTSAG